jgi:hypothetical protein
MTSLTKISAHDLKIKIDGHFDWVKNTVKIDNILCTDRFDFDWPRKLTIRFNNCEFNGPAILYSIPAESEVVFNHCTFLHLYFCSFVFASSCSKPKKPQRPKQKNYHGFFKKTKP